MPSEHHMTGRSSYDPNLSSEVRYSEGGAGKILLVVAALIVVIGAILWFGAGSDTGTTTTAPDAGAPAALAPADPSVPEAAPVTDPAAPAADPAAPVTDPAAPPVDPSPTAPAQ